MTLKIHLSTIRMRDFWQPLRTQRRKFARDWLFTSIVVTNSIRIAHVGRRPSGFGSSIFRSLVFHKIQYGMPDIQKLHLMDNSQYLKCTFGGPIPFYFTFWTIFGIVITLFYQWTPETICENTVAVSLIFGN